MAGYQELARRAITGLRAAGRGTLLVGGSGLYVRAALDELDFPGTDPVLRAHLEAELAELGPGPLHARLLAADPAAAAAILPGNGRRIVRALEVIALTGGPLRARLPAYDEAHPAVQVALAVPRAELDQRIAERVDRMWAAGLVAEVQELERAGLRQGRTAARALGYAQVLRMLAGEATEEQARVDTVRATRRFARRQESWFRRDPRVHWLRYDDLNLLDRALELTKASPAV